MSILFTVLFLLVFSIFLNVFFLGFIRLGFLGNNLNLTLNYLLEKNINLIPIFNFFIFMLLILYLNLNVIYLDSSDFIVTASLENTKFELSGDVLKMIFENLGSAGVFAVGARIAASLIVKHPMGVLPKLGVIGGSGAGCFATIAYKMIMDQMGTNVNNSSASVSISPVAKQITLEKIEHLNPNVNIIDSLTNNLGLNNVYFNNLKIIASLVLINGKTYLNSVDNNSCFASKIISALDQQYPDWRNSFINSSLENNQIIIDTLSNNILLQFIILYLLFMLLIIITCKFIIKDNIEFKKLKSYRLGGLISYIINKIISLWKVSSNVWIYFILFNIFFFVSVSIYSIYNLIVLL